MKPVTHWALRPALNCPSECELRAAAVQGVRYPNECMLLGRRASCKKRENLPVIHVNLHKWTWLRFECIALQCIFSRLCCKLLARLSRCSVLLKSANKLLWLMIIAVKCLFLVISAMCWALAKYIYTLKKEDSLPIQKPF